MNKLTQKTCLRCGHTWWPRGVEAGRTCPHCRSPYWDRERRPAKNKEPAKEVKLL